MLRLENKNLCSHELLALLNRKKFCVTEEGAIPKPVLHQAANCT